MGINLQQAVLLETWARRHALQGPVTTLGVQHLDFSARDLAIALGRTPPQSAAHGEAAPADGTMSAAQLFAACGLSGTSAVDIAGSEGADIDFDLNSPELPAQLAGKSRLVVNGGTLEHVFHVPNALTNLTRMLAPGGSILHILPCHNCVDHGFYQFGPTFVFDYYSAASFEILESAAIAFDAGDPQRRAGRVFPVPDGAFGTGLIGALPSDPLLLVALVRKTRSAHDAPVPRQRLYAKAGSRRIAAPGWFAPFSLAPGEAPVVSRVHELGLGPFAPAGGLAWTCALAGAGVCGDTADRPIRSPLVVLEDGRPLGPPHADHDAIRAHGGGAFSHWGAALVMSTSDGTDPNRNGRRYAAHVPALPAGPDTIEAKTAEAAE
jgi:hypothetical protein